VELADASLAAGDVDCDEVVLVGSLQGARFSASLWDEKKSDKVDYVK
jgi:hypothetical protein